MMLNTTACGPQGANDVCSVPKTSAIPTAYVNSSIAAANGVKYCVVGNDLHFASGVGAFVGENLMTTESLSSGDESGVLEGLVSGMLVAGNDGNVLGSLKTFNGVQPASRMTGMTGANTTPVNVPSAAVAAQQHSVMVLA